jgi:LacI family transcriptional regulator
MLAGITADNDRAADRVRGVHEALAEVGLKLRPESVAEAAYDLQSAREATRQLLAVHPTPTALLCGNDVLAYGALLEAQSRGTDVPTQLSVVGFDDLEMSRHWQPGLTTIHVPTEGMWTLAAEHLIARLDGVAPGPLQQEIEVELVVRGSTARPARPARTTRRR